jgi:alpha-L-arabinofuranosidase
LLFAFLFAASQNIVVIYAEQEKTIINKDIYCNFAGHLTRGIHFVFYEGGTNKMKPNVGGMRYGCDS